MKEYIVQASEQGTIDSFDVHNATELVRCKDCIWRKNNGATSLFWVPCMDNRYDDDFFCAYGERKE